MTKEDQNAQRKIAWNGVGIVVPKSWEAKAIGVNHLHLEDNFQPVLELRWQQKFHKKVDDNIRRMVIRLEKTTDRKLHKVPLAETYLSKLNSFAIQCFSATKNGEPQYVFLYNEKHAVFVILQFVVSKKRAHPLQCIDTIECSPQNDPQYWSIQDFRFFIPSSFTLLSHTMDAGFTTLNFKNSSTQLHLCRLAPASMRLKHNSLQEILSSLLGLERSLEDMSVSESGVQYERNPSLLHQILLRIRRKKPFIRSKIWHDQVNDRLLGVFMEAVQPIDVETHEMICSSYEIFQNK